MATALRSNLLSHSILVEGLIARPELVVGLGLLLHAAIWFVASLLAHPTPDPKLAIGLALGHEWKIGYLETPPLAPWLLELAFRVGGVIALYALGPVSVAIAGWLVFLFARDVVGARHAAFAVLLMVGVFPVAFPVGAFDADLVQMPLSAGLVLAWWRTLKTGSRLAYLLLGIVAVAIAYAGVQGLFILLTLLALTVASPDARAAFARHESLVGAVAAVLALVMLLTPRLVWLGNHQFAGLIPSLDAPELIGPLDPVLLGAAVLLGHAGLLALAILGSPLFARAGETPSFLRLHFDHFGRAAAIAITLLPPALAWAASFVAGIKLPAGAAAPLVLYSGLFVMLFAGPTLTIHRPRTVGLGAALLLVLPPALIAANAFAAPWISDRGRHTNWPAAAVAAYVTDVYRTRTSRPLEIVVGEPRIASQIALASRDRPRVFFAGEPARSPWLTPDAVKRTGAVVIWEIRGAEIAPPPPIAATLAPLTPEAPLNFRWVRQGRLDIVRIGWAIVPPGP